MVSASNDIRNRLTVLFILYSKEYIIRIDANHVMAWMLYNCTQICEKYTVSVALINVCGASLHNVLTELVNVFLNVKTIPSAHICHWKCIRDYLGW